MDSLPFDVPKGFTEFARFDTEDCEIVMLAVKPTTALAEILLAQEETAEPLAALARERRRQIEAEGWSPEHDDEHAHGELSLAAACYALPGEFPQRNRYVMSLWPWNSQWWKPGTARRSLEKAGALTLAEMERLQRQRSA